MRRRRWWHEPRVERARFAAFVILIAIAIIYGYFALIGPMMDGTGK
jgi:hypothetical protein